VVQALSLMARALSHPQVGSQRLSKQACLLPRPSEETPEDVLREVPSNEGGAGELARRLTVSWLQEQLV